ncbi:DUF5331 domain-containing protein [Anabaena sp. UHCC 0204]|uniref:DUF5331 domain-containing protein n=1 Tax=Anabaena sp. UHCC 0204 TaxID=2590009 RepID=UPI001445238E|nr:DUF5331 domain-containing protein [Anabaena sp. UHCC 0204]MTJ10352.1 hypothetical protein [Anabaena sp. UHCC 0204]
MAFFDSFTDSLKQKWLQFFQANREWITLQMTVESVYTPDGGKRPSSYLILGVVNALEPKLAQLMFPFAKLNPDADTLIEVLDLNFDPDIALGNSISPTVEPAMYSRPPAVVMEEVSEPEEESFPVTDISINGLGEETQESWAVESDDDGFGEISLSDEDITNESEESLGDFGEVSFDAMSLTDESDDQGFNAIASEDDNAFGEIAENAFGEIDENAFTGLNLSEENGFDALSTSEESGFDALSTSEENGFDDVVSDIWGNENNDLLMEELPSEVFDESEMARLFPNN